jgi:nitronate monooxygenase
MCPGYKQYYKKNKHIIMPAMPSLKIGNIETRFPVIQGGMGVGVSLAGLASAVAEEGGIGVIASVGIGEKEPDVHTDYSAANKRALIREIQKARSKTDGVIGVNIMVALTDFNSHIEGAIEGGADIVFMGAGLPRKMPCTIPLDALDSLHTRFVPIISSAKAAKIILKYWSKKYSYVPDAVVVEGPMAGGHLGFRPEQIDDAAYRLENLVPQVLEAVEPFQQESGKKIAVIAAGGIYTGADISRFLQMGVSAVQMATRFITTEECDAAPAFKQMYLDCGKDDMMIIKSPVGIPGRAIRNRFLEEVESGTKMPFRCPWKCLQTCDVVNSPYCIALALLSAKEGKLDNGFAFGGSNAWRNDRIITVKQLFRDLQEEYSRAVQQGVSAET